MEEDRPLGHSMVRTEGSGQHGGQGVETGQECLRVWGHAVSRVRKEGRSEQAGRLGPGCGPRGHCGRSSDMFFTRAVLGE